MGDLSTDSKNNHKNWVDLGFVRQNRRILVFLPPIHESSKKSARTEKTIFISPIKPVKKPAVSCLDEIAYDSIRTLC